MNLYNWYITESKSNGRSIRTLFGNITGHEKYLDSTFVRSAEILSIKTDYTQGQMIILTADNAIFYCPLIYLNFRKYEEECLGADYIPDYEFIKEKYAGKIPYPKIEPGKILLVLSNCEEHYFHSAYCREAADSEPLKLDAFPHIGMFQDSFLILGKNAWINIGYFPGERNIHIYRTRTNGMPLYVENIGFTSLRVNYRAGSFLLEPGERKLVCDGEGSK